MNVSTLETEEDLAWLREVHLSWLPDHYWSRVRVAVLSGNEDAPNEIELYSENHFQRMFLVIRPA